MFIVHFASITSPHSLQVLPQDLPSGAVGGQAQESLSVQGTQLAPCHAPQIWAQALEAEFSLAPVQPVIHLPFRPQVRIWTKTKLEQNFQVLYYTLGGYC